VGHDAGSRLPVLQMRLLGRTGLKLAEIGFGAWAIGGGSTGQSTPSDEASSLDALQRAFELGVNFVDTADSYGNGRSEELVGQAVKVSPRRVHIATKVGRINRDAQDFSAAHIKSACDRSLERLGVTIIDLYQLHNPPREVIESNEVWDALRELKDKTKIAHYGISVGNPEEGVLAIQKGDVDAVQVVYNLLDRDAADVLFGVAESKSVGIIARMPLATGLLTGQFSSGHRFADDDRRRKSYSAEKLDAAVERAEKFRFLSHGTGRTMAQAAIRFCLAHPAVSVVVPGIKTPYQAIEDIEAAGAPELTPAELQRIREI